MLQVNIRIFTSSKIRKTNEFITNFQNSFSVSETKLDFGMKLGFYNSIEENVEGANKSVVI